MNHRHLPFLLLVTLAACGPRQAAPTADPALLEARARITAMEDSLAGAALVDQRNARALIDVYKAYATAYALDTMAPDYLFRAASVHSGLEEHDKALVLLERIMRDYQSWNHIANAWFTKAFVLDQYMGRKGEAGEAYDKVILQFGDHPVAEQARQLKADLFLTDAEFLERAERMKGGEAGL